MLASPLRFAPFLRPMVWGGRRLATALGKPLPTNEPYGESWEISDHRLHRSLAVTGPAMGQSLRQLMEQHRPALLGRATETRVAFPWLVKFLDASDWLSIQVHPNEEAVRRHLPGEGSKTEAWFVLEAAPGSRIYAGLMPGIDEVAMRAALATGTVARCLHQVEPQPGDCFFLPAGTVHAVGGGVLLAEVQETSDATFRLFDWDRKDAEGRARPLHIEEALASIDWSHGPVSPVQVGDFTAKGPAPACCRQSLVRCACFALDFIAEAEPFDWGGVGRLQVLIVVRGSARLLTTAGEETVTAGQAWLLPAIMPPVRCLPAEPLTALQCTLPVE